MRINISARHFKASDNLKSFASDEVKRLKKYYDGIIDCEIILGKQKDVRSCDVIIKVYGLTLTASESTHDHFKSVVGAVDKMENQLRKYKSKLRDQRAGKNGAKITI